MRACGRFFRAVAGAAFLCLPTTTALHAQTSGSEALSNGAVVAWRIEEGDTDHRLGLSVPAFAQWTRSGFDEPVAMAMRSDALAAIDAWELSFYRAGDVEMKRPVRRFRGDARSLDAPLLWDGRVEDGPPPRPGETLVAQFSVRDVAGAVDRAKPQEMLIARYTMRAEQRSIKTIEAERAEAFAKGMPPLSGDMPVRGSVLMLRVSGWPDAQAPRASGVALRRNGGEWVLRQILPPGRHDIVIQSARPIIGGMREIPVGIVGVESPDAAPFHAVVKGTARLGRSPLTTRALSSPRFDPEAMVTGRAAISRTMMDRGSGEDRLALALIAADRPVTLAVDDRMRRAFLTTHDGATVSWPGGAAARALDDPALRRETVTFAAIAGPWLALPHTDITPGSLRLSLRSEGAALEPERDYAFDAGEGRIRLAAPTLERLSREPEGAVDASYVVPAFATGFAAGPAVRDGGAAFAQSWVEDAQSRRPVQDARWELGDSLRRLFDGE